MPKETIKPETGSSGSAGDIESKHYIGEKGQIVPEFGLENDISIMKAKELIADGNAEVIFKDIGGGLKSLTVMDKEYGHKMLYTEIQDEVADIENYMKLFSK